MFCGRTGIGEGVEEEEEIGAVLDGEAPFPVPLGSIFTSFRVVSTRIPFTEGWTGCITAMRRYQVWQDVALVVFRPSAALFLAFCSSP